MGQGAVGLQGDLTATLMFTKPSSLSKDTNQCLHQ